MSDQGKWFKLWCSGLHDDDLENLTVHEWFCWVRLGAHIKAHGKDGKIRFRSPGTSLVNLFRTPSFDAAIDIIKRLPNFRIGERESTVSTETNVPVTYEIESLNWWKYQGDFSSERVRKFRDKKRHRETAQEETRRDEKRRDITPTPAPDGRVKKLIDFFHQTLTAHLGEAPVLNGGSAGKIFKNLLRDHAEDEITRRISVWPKSNESFIAKRSWCVEDFAKYFSQLKEGPINVNTHKPVNAFVAENSESRKYDKL